MELETPEDADFLSDLENDFGELDDAKDYGHDQAHADGGPDVVIEQVEHMGVWNGKTFKEKIHGETQYAQESSNTQLSVLNEDGLCNISSNLDRFDLETSYVACSAFLLNSCGGLDSSAFNQMSFDELSKVLMTTDSCMRHVYQKLLISVPTDYSELLKLVRTKRLSVELLQVLLGAEKNNVNSVTLESQTKLSKEEILLVTLHLNNMALLDSQTRAQQEKELKPLITYYQNLEAIRFRFISLLSSEVEQEAPNLVNLVGSEISTQLLQITSGLKNLVSVPNSNLPSMGKKYIQEHTEINQNMYTGDKAKGVLYYAELVQKQDTEEARKKALKMLSGKIVLCARVDFSKSDVSGGFGSRTKLELEKKLQNYNEPPLITHVKALPIPKDNAYIDGKDCKKKRRGGNKVTKYRNKFRLTKTQQLRNRMEFGKAETYLNDAYAEEDGLGLAGQKALLANTGSGGVVKPQLSKELEKRLRHSDKSETNDSIKMELDKDFA